MDITKENTNIPETSDMLIRFGKPYTFEGESYTEIDLSGLEDITSADMIAAEKHLNRSGVVSPMPEMTLEYVCFIANRASGQPIEFFKKLPPREMTKIKNKVTGFFYGED